MHKEGFSAASIGRIIAHYTRGLYEGESVDYPRSAGGGHIDPEKKQLNYQLGECHGAEWVRERLKDVYTRPQDANRPRMLDIVVTLPTDEAPENAREFFAAAYKSLCKQFQKKNNIVGAWVHMDEAQPHMHFTFLPIVDKTMKKNPEVKEGISQKAYFPHKSSLQTMHKVTQKDISEALGHRVALLNEVTKAQGGNKSISQLKTESKKAIKLAVLERVGLQEAKAGIAFKNPLVGEKHYRVDPEQMKIIWKYARAGAEATATEKERQRELQNARARENQADQERKAVENQLAVANRNNDELHKQLQEADIFLNAPPSQQAQLAAYAEYSRENFRDFADCVHRQAVRGYLGAGKSIEPVVRAMGKALAYIGVDRAKMGEYILSCASACKRQARQFFKCRELGQASSAPERSPSWWPEPQETDFSQQEEDPRHLQRLEKMQTEQITKEKGVLFSHFQLEAAKARNRSMGKSGRG